METMKVKPWGEGQGDHVVINVSDFDPKKHTPLDGEDSGAVDFSKMTKAQLHAHLDEAGVAYETDANKARLVELAEEHAAGE